MPRSARKKSNSGIYHIVLRGINRQSIFEDDEDREKFILTIRENKNKTKVYGYCLMDNHVHLLLKDENLSITMRSICASYVFWYNKKYQRCGHLYQDRFMSEPVETDKYFLAVLRYIHQNPLKAGLIRKIDDYRWSSYREYVGKQEVVDTGYVFELMNQEEFIKFNKSTNSDICLEMRSAPLSDEDARKIIFEITGIGNISDLQMLDKDERNNCLRQIKETEGLSIRQIARVTGLSRKIVETA